MTPLAVETFISSGFDGMPKNAVFPHVLPLKEGQWLGAESNRRHVDFQSTALPTELPSRNRRRTARRREVFTMQQCDCTARLCRIHVRATQPAVMLSGALRAFPFLQRPDSPQSRIWPSCYRRYCHTDATDNG